MRHGCMRIIFKPRCNRRSGLGKGLQDKKGTDGQVKDQGDIGCVLCLERHCPSSIFTTWSDGKQLCQEILARLRDSLRRKRTEFWENQTWMLHHDYTLADASLLIRIYLAKRRISVLPQSNVLYELSPNSFFSVSQT